MKCPNHFYFMKKIFVYMEAALEFLISIPIMSGVINTLNTPNPHTL